MHVFVCRKEIKTKKVENKTAIKLKHIRGILGIPWTKKVTDRDGACKTELDNCRLVKLLGNII